MLRQRVGKKDIFRVIDANFNRAKEGLRVCEDTARFVLDDARLTARAKRARHVLTAAAGVFGLKEVASARDILKDVGKKTTGSESKRSSVGEIFYANAQRVKESLRVLEEFAKLENIKAAERFKKLRYEVYDFERETLGRL